MGHPTNRDFFLGIPQAPVVQIPTVEDNNVEIVSEIWPDSMNRVGTTFRRGFDRGSILDWLVLTGTMEFHDFPSGMSFIPTDEVILTRGVESLKPPTSIYIYTYYNREKTKGVISSHIYMDNNETTISSYTQYYIYMYEPGYKCRYRYSS